MHINILFSFLLLYSLVSKGQSDDEKLIRHVLHQQVESWNSGNLPEYMKGYWNSDSLVFVGSGGAAYGYEPTLHNYEKNYPDSIAMGKLSFDILQTIPLSRQFYYVIGKWHLHRQQDDLDGQFTLLFKKIKNRWMIIVDHSS